MESPNLSRRRPRDEDEDEDDIKSESTSNSRASSAKRPRLNPADSDNEPTEDQDAEEDEEEEDEAEADENGEGESDAESNSSSASQTIANPPQVAPHDGLGPGGYKPGAIVRIKVTNFVTYTSAEFFPGPKLNMVIGPNGTGKSTLVCAICLGLGWGPQHLGRAKDLGEFVKHGNKEAIIEIELCGPPKIGHNPIIQRTIKRDGNKSSFLLDGQTASKNDVLKLAQSFAIQVDNLCQFLPQDKVAEFAALTPIDLLHSTQRAAAGPEMLGWHDDLKTLRSKQKKLELDNGGDKDTLVNLESRQEMQRADVERMRERAEIEQAIAMLKKCRPAVAFKEHVAATQAMIAEKKDLDAEYAQLKEETEPVLRAVTAKEAYIEELNGARDDRKDAVDEASKVTLTKGKLIDDFDAKISEINAQKAQQQINQFQRQLNDEAVEFDPEVFNESLREKRLQRRAMETRAQEIKDQHIPLLEEQNQVRRDIKQAETQLANLDSAAGQQEIKLEQISRDTLRAYKWLLENQNKFEQEVFGPPIVTCSVTDPKFADAIESLFQRTDFTSFTTQNRNDFRTMQRELIHGMKLHDISIRTCSLSLDRMSPPMPNDQIRQLGFDGWARDLLAGPDPVIAMLCSEKNLHATPIAFREISEDVFNRLQDSSLSAWVTGKSSYNITRRREYGPCATSTRVRQIQPAKVWTSQPVDQSLKRSHQENIAQWNEQLTEISNKLETSKNTGLKLREEMEQLAKETRAIEREKDEKQTAHTQYRALPQMISHQKAKLESVTAMFDTVRETVRAYRNEQDDLAIQKAEATVEYADAVELFRQAYEELMKIQVQFLEANSDLQTLRQRNVETTRILDEKREHLMKFTATLRELKLQTRNERQEALRIIEEVNGLPGGPEIMNEINDHDIARLEADIESQVARLQFTHGGSDHMVKEFEAREKTIDKLRTKLADFEAKLVELSAAITEIRNVWEPRLEALIGKISDAFSDSFRRIGCAGQVTLGKAESEPGPNGEPGVSEFAEWSIVIHVAFRQDAPLSVLNSHRQSGGERAVSTIFYLMALQSLSASPFRVVDEINQGMDPRNERMVHGRLVDIACASSESDEVDNNGNPIGGGGGGQYFLITPKLLNGLAYKRGMRVLCIYSGEHMPQDYDKINFKEAIRKMAALSGKEVGLPIQGSAPVYA
ncbi:uncharacterized protein N7506_008938 [Penicillium brevicompactum]|uniref:uncharacterized protein n=1 Tax=Penicillium brevicompactum TaxID=5074 RepID=UPI002540F797|nr:uncharacterized protein N7506_008938 [Penicillium brevicompactum]KAJ5325836.1 hypothetical protein N7506_008938 [Penicillium brevicompactum]